MTASMEVPAPDVLNLGCGRDYREQAWNVDINESVPADEHLDIGETPWPWPDNSFDTIVARHVLEHLDPVPWSELERVLGPGGRLLVEYPIGHTRFEDGSHQQYWNVNTAEWIAGERKHSHEAPLDARLVERDVKWHADSRLITAWVRWRLRREGIGPWLGQMPGVYGHVRAIYERPASGGGES